MGSACDRNHHRRGEDRRRQSDRRDRARRHADRAPRRDRAVALGQDRVHHRSRPQPRAWRPPAAVRPCERAARRAPSSSRSPTTTCRASPTRSTSRDLVEERDWPELTRRISELRVAIEYESARGLKRTLGRGRLNARHRRLSRRMAARPAAADRILRRVVARKRFAVARAAPRGSLAADWLARLVRTDAAWPRRRGRRRASLPTLFTGYLQRRPRRRARAFAAARRAAS